MFIRYDPDSQVSESTHTVCVFHQKFPEIHNYAGCTCSSSWGLRQATSEEYQENRKRRLEQEKHRREAFKEFGI